LPYRNVVVGTDGSATAELAVRHAGELAAAGGARLVVVTAYQPDGDQPVTDGSSVPDEIAWMLTDRNRAEERARHGRDVAAELGASDIVVQATEGSPADVLLEAAEDFGADVIVVGSKGLTGVGRVLGSVASAVAHHAPCDVLIVHTTR